MSKSQSFSPGEAWHALWTLEMIRRYGAQAEADRREADSEYMALVTWARAHPQPSPLEAKRWKKQL